MGSPGTDTKKAWLFAVLLKSGCRGGVSGGARATARSTKPGRPGRGVILFRVYQVRVWLACRRAHVYLTGFRNWRAISYFLRGSPCGFRGKQPVWSQNVVWCRLYALPRRQAGAVKLEPWLTFSPVSSPIQERQGPLRLEYRRRCARIEGGCSAIYCIWERSTAAKRAAWTKVMGSLIAQASPAVGLVSGGSRGARARDGVWRAGAFE